MTYRPYNQLTSSGTTESRPNNTGVTITKASPVIINSSGELDTVDVSVEADALSVAGVAAADILDSTNGNIINSGRLTDITTTAAFGDVLYAGKLTSLTNVKPSVGIGGFATGDLVVIIGVVAKNIDNPSIKDLVLNINIVGQL